MSRYALLLAPSANRVYADQAGRLTRAELAAFSPVLSAPLADLEETTIGGVGYLTFTGDLTPRDVAYLSNLSSGYALFEQAGPEPADLTPVEAGFLSEIEDEDAAESDAEAAGVRTESVLLRPVMMTPLARYDSDLITIPKYAGKTNEQFTKLLLNLTLLASASAPRMLDGGLTVGDPLCGRGTTLNQALMYGYDALGVEIDDKDVEAYKLFLQTWLKRKRLKHNADFNPVRRQGRRAARRLEITLAASKEEHKAGAVQKLIVLNADATQLDGLVRPNCVDVLVTDLPYGVAHGSYDDTGGISRRPLDLLERAIPQWLPLLRPGGALGISWNTKVAKRELAEDILLAGGLELVPYDDLSHRVDQGIERDVVVARKPR